MNELGPGLVATAAGALCIAACSSSSVPGRLNEVSVEGGTRDADVWTADVEPRPEADGASDRESGACEFVTGAGEIDARIGAPAAPCATSMHDVTDAVYATTPRALHFTLLRPLASTAPIPTVIWIHGGGWRSGDYARDYNQALRLVCAGFALASIEYRLTGEAPDASYAAVFPAQVQDVQAAIRYLRANASSLGIDADRFALFGSSAGGHLAALAGTAADAPELADPDGRNPGASSRVRAVVDWYGPTDLPAMDQELVAQGNCMPGAANHGSAQSAESELLGCQNATAGCLDRARLANPMTYVDPGDPPFLIMHGDQDCTVPRAQSVALASALDRAAVCVRMRTVLGAGHGTEQWSYDAPQIEVVDFLKAVLR
jgi:acetyl esterase/lipase